jgi:hypothetical protein
VGGNEELPEEPCGHLQNQGQQQLRMCYVCVCIIQVTSAVWTGQ